VKTIIELGANRGTDTVRLLEEYKDAIVYAFEPTHELLINYLWPIARNYDRLRVMPFAVDVECSFKTFKIAGQADWGCSSLYDFADDIHTKWPGRPDFKMTDRYDVPTITMYDFCKLFKISSVDYLHIDTQGNDFNCMLSFGEYFNLVKAGRCEVAANTELYKNTNNTYLNVKHWLQQQGFVVTTNANIEQAHEIDLIFRK